MTTPPSGASRRELLGRIRAAVRGGSYLVPNKAGPPSQRPALEIVARMVREPGADPRAVRARIHQLAAAGRLDRVATLSALGVLAASPLARDPAEALRLAGQQELAALDEGGPWLSVRLASVARHRGVVFFLLGHDLPALDWFERALAHHRTAENLGNVLAALLRLGERAEAEAVVDGMRAALPGPDWEAFAAHVRADDDLARLRDRL